MTVNQDSEPRPPIDLSPIQRAASQTAAALAHLGQEFEIAVSVGALPALPLDAQGDRYGVRRLTASWLKDQRSVHTRREYFKDLARWLAWCQQRDLDPLTARPADASDWRASLEDSGTAPTTAARRMAAVSSWYRHLIANSAAGGNPFAGARRPRVDRDASTTAGLTFDEMCALLDTADSDHGPARLRTRALIRLLVETGMRVGEVLSLDVSSLSYNQGYRTVRYTGKGGKRRERSLHPDTLGALDEYLADRATKAGCQVVNLAGPLFCTDTGRRLDEPAVFRLVRRLARQAAIPHADRLSVHSIRHGFITFALEHQALHKVQEGVGHADPRTTQRYNRARNQLAHDPSLVVGGLFAARRRD